MQKRRLIGSLVAGASHPVQEFQQGPAHAIVPDPRELFDEFDRARKGKSFQQRIFGPAPRIAQQFPDAALEARRKLDQDTNRHPVGAAFVFLNLLIADACGPSQYGLAQPELDPTFLDARSKGDVSLIGTRPVEGRGQWQPWLQTCFALRVRSKARETLHAL